MTNPTVESLQDSVPDPVLTDDLPFHELRIGKDDHILPTHGKYFLQPEDQSPVLSLIVGRSTDILAFLEDGLSISVQKNHANTRFPWVAFRGTINIELENLVFCHGI